MIMVFSFLELLGIDYSLMSCGKDILCSLHAQEVSLSEPNKSYKHDSDRAPSSSVPEVAYTPIVEWSSTLTLRS